MKIVNCEQGSQEWYKAKRGLLTSSNFGALLKYRGAYKASRRSLLIKLLLERYEDETEQITSKNTEYGHTNEPVARLAYELQTGYSVTRVGLVIDESLNCGASTDGLINDDGVLEIKSLDKKQHIAIIINPKIPSKFKPQVQGEILVSNRKWAEFVSHNPYMKRPKDQLVPVRVERDQDYIDMLTDEIIKFNKDLDDMHSKLLASS